MPVDARADKTGSAAGDEPPKRRRWVKIAGRILLVTAALVALVALVAIIQGWEAFGTAPEGARLERMRASEQWLDDVFENPEPLYNDTAGSLGEAFDASDQGSPKETPEVLTVDPAMFATPPSTGLRVTWLGHSTMLIEIEGKRFLTDPLFSKRISPLSWIGPECWYAPPIALADLPKLDAVIISHDHYDHLDHKTMVALSGHDTTFIAPLGVGAHLAYWGVPEDRIVELDWWQEHTFGQLRVVATPARHASGRHLLDQNRTLWAGYAFVGAKRRLFFSGDTGLFPGLREIGRRLGPFDMTMLEVGAYGQAWPDWHLGPEQAVRAHRMLQGTEDAAASPGVMLPVHWGLVNLAYHAWTEPIERTLLAAEGAGVMLATPKPGGTIEPTTTTRETAINRWWPKVPWRTAEQYPIRATKVD